jgi:hypothetical protein
MRPQMTSEEIGIGFTAGPDLFIGPVVGAEFRSFPTTFCY